MSSVDESTWEHVHHEASQTMSSYHNRYTLQCVFVAKAMQEYLKVSVATDKTTTVQVFEGNSEGPVDHG